MCELSTLISDYMDFRAARRFQPNRKTEHLLTQFANALPAERDDGCSFPRVKRWRGHTHPWEDIRHGCPPGCLPSEDSRTTSLAPACPWACPPSVKELADPAGRRHICTRSTTSGP
jgi:hypothetical protein